MTTRRWIILTAIIASILWTGSMMKRRAYYLDQVAIYRPCEFLYSHTRNFEINGKPILNFELFDETGAMKPEDAKDFARMHEYYSGLVSKYRHAASHPWVYVEPDPPKPR